MKERIKSKLKDSTKLEPKLKTKDESDQINDEETNKDKIEEYYLGKDRDDERKRKAYVLFYNV